MKFKQFIRTCGVKIRQRDPALKHEFGRLRILGHEFVIGVKTCVVCECECGTVKVVTTNMLHTGDTLSCGCRQREIAGALRRTHGKSQTQVYMVWASMIRRCHDCSIKGYERYGGRGISVCPRWRESFEAFSSDMGDRPSGMSIERRDNNGDYEPSNCHWATSDEQANNTRRSVKLEFYGRMKTVTEWSVIACIPVNTIYSRLKKGWPPKLAVWAQPGDVTRINGVLTG